MRYMKVVILILAIFLVSVATVAYVNAELGKTLPKDEPNFMPTITNGTYNGKDVQIIEFKSKLEK
jgi:uncharacterized membrane protein YczE